MNGIDNSVWMNAQPVGDDVGRRSPNNIDLSPIRLNRSCLQIVPEYTGGIHMNGLSVLAKTAQDLVTDGKGILAADESFGTIKKRFTPFDIESTDESRRAYRELLFTAPDVEKYISGVIMFDETIRQKTRTGVPFPEYLADRGIIPGIKVDAGAKDMAHFPGEKITEGLDGLRQRLNDYRELGARFTKWRAVIKIGAGIPTQTCIDANAEALARYAALAQEAGLVPVVEPEVLMDGDHDIEVTEAVTIATLLSVFQRLQLHLVILEEMLLKPNMVVPGQDSQRQVTGLEVAAMTIRTLRKTVPPAVPGIVFLSGGQSPEQATEHLNAMNALGLQPWKLSFSYGRALQEPSIEAWAGDEKRVSVAQNLFEHRARMNQKAASGAYKSEMEKEVAALK
jgi:fructose-bisphosphate aldolase class I